MHSPNVSLQQSGGEATFTEGDEGEQIVASVLLAAMAFQLYSETAARAYVEYAYALANSLAQRSVTYRPSRPSKFARLSFEAEGKVETFLVSVINDALVVPAFSSALKINVFALQPQSSSLNKCLRTPTTIKFVGIELVRFTLRLRMRRIVAALETLRTTMSQAALFQAVEYLLTECLRHEVRSAEPLDQASDCFMLAHDLVGKRSYPLAALLLNNAAGALDKYLNSSQVPGHSAIVHSMKGEIGSLLGKIAQTAA
jgi:hypothetical protein